MEETYNIYCDESCHLENDGQDVMVLGAVWCPLEQSRMIAEDLRSIRLRHRLPSEFEIKWSKVSPAKVDFYSDIVKYFFSNEHLSFRAVVIPDKSKLRHGDFRQQHDDWYYKMYFNLLKVILEPTCKYRIYLDIKDTRSMGKIAKLRDVLCSNMYDFDRNIIQRIQPVHSHEVEQIQLVDLLIGAVCYVNRNLTSSHAKTTLVDQIRAQTGYSLTRSTLLREKKYNVLIWQAQEDTQLASYRTGCQISCAWRITTAAGNATKTKSIQGSTPILSSQRHTIKTNPSTSQSN